MDDTNFTLNISFPSLWPNFSEAVTQKGESSVTQMHQSPTIAERYICPSQVIYLAQISFYVSSTSFKLRNIN